MGKILALNNNYQRSIYILNNASKLTSNPYLYNSLGNRYQAIKEYKKAKEAYLPASYLIPHKFYSRYLLVKLYVEMNDPKKALSLA